MYASVNSEQVDSNTIMLNIYGNKRWVNIYSRYAIDAHEYIGVTPNTQYCINIQASSRIGLTCYISISIKYSSEINKKTPTVTDY